MSSTDQSTTPNDRSFDKEASERPHNAAAGPGGAGEPDAAAASSHFKFSFHEAVFIFVIGTSQLFSVGGLGNTAYSAIQIGHVLNVTSNGRMS